MLSPITVSSRTAASPSKLGIAAGAAGGDRGCFREASVPVRIRRARQSGPSANARMTVLESNWPAISASVIGG